MPTDSPKRVGVVPPSAVTSRTAAGAVGQGLLGIDLNLIDLAQGDRVVSGGVLFEHGAVHVRRCAKDKDERDGPGFYEAQIDHLEQSVRNILDQIPDLKTSCRIHSDRSGALRFIARPAEECGAGGSTVGAPWWLMLRRPSWRLRHGP